MGLHWGSLRPESPEHSGTAPTPGLGSACSHLAVDRRRPRKVGREAYLNPGAPVANLLLSGQPARTRLRGLPRALGPHLRPARRAPTRNRTFAPRRKWLRVGWVPRVRMRPCAPHRRRSWAVELERLQVADLLYLYRPTTATSAGSTTADRYRVTRDRHLPFCSGRSPMVDTVPGWRYLRAGIGAAGKPFRL